MTPTLERFIGILLEHYAGKLPLWLAPTQAVVATITTDVEPYAAEVLGRLKAAGLRAHADFRNEKINYKIREHSLAKVPNLLVLGRREAETGSIAVRALGSPETRVLPLEDWLSETAPLARLPA